MIRNSVKLNLCNHCVVFILKFFYRNFIDCITCGPFIALEVLCNNGKDSLEDLKKLLEKDVEFSENKELSEKVYTILKFLQQNFIETLQKIITVFFTKQLEYIFINKGNGSKIPPESESCTCCVIKPHAVQSQLIGSIIDDIQKSGFVISAIQQFYLDPVSAEEFLEVYKGVLADFPVSKVNEKVIQYKFK